MCARVASASTVSGFAALLCYDGERVFVITGRGAPADLVVSRQLVMSLVANRHQAASPKTVA
jgi:hypothetical protein